jgi:purine catabolism regulator
MYSGGLYPLHEVAQSAITVRDLVSHPPLGLRILAGGDGLDRPISWANPTDMPDPTGWLFGDELVLITSRAFPTGSDGQRTYLTGLIEGGTSGLGISVKGDSAVLTQASVELADLRSFPILGVPYDVAFSNITRHVAYAVHSDQAPPLSAIQRLYEAALAMTVGSLGAVEILERLAQALGAELALIDVSLGRADAKTGEAVAEVANSATRQLGHSDENAPTFIYFDDPLAAAMRIPTYSHLYLVALGSSSRPALAPLQHASTILALSLRFDAAEADLAVVSATRMVDAFIAGQVTIDQVALCLQRMGLGNGPWVVLSLPQEAVGALIPELRHRHLPSIPFGADGSCTHVLVAEDAVALVEELDQTAWIGASAAFSRLADLREAVAEARLALRATFGGPPGLRRYGSSEWSPLAPSSLEEANRFTASVLGPLLEESERKPWLEPTLRAYLELERSPSATAKHLGIHRQTLVNRLQRIEELLDSGLKQSEDLARVWTALRLRDEQLGVAPARRPPVAG